MAIFQERLNFHPDQSKVGVAGGFLSFSHFLLLDELLNVRFSFNIGKSHSFSRCLTWNSAGDDLLDIGIRWLAHIWKLA
jgi:hypothetical protein